MPGLSYFKVPFFEHDCPRCKFLFAIQQDFGPKLDVYESCDNSGGQTPYLARYSSEPGDYSTVGLTTLFWSYARDHSPDWRDNLTELSGLSDAELTELPALIDKEWTRRITEKLRELGPGTQVRYLTSGFCCGAHGRNCEFTGFITEPTGAEVATFGLDGVVYWHLELSKLGALIQIT
jgi:hypothetical protein